MGGVAGDQIIGVPGIGMGDADSLYRLEDSPVKMLALNQPIIRVKVFGHHEIRVAETQWLWTKRGLVQSRDLVKGDSIKIAPPLNIVGPLRDTEVEPDGDLVPETILRGDRKTQIWYLKKFLENRKLNKARNIVELDRDKKLTTISILLQNIGIYNRYIMTERKIYISDIESIEMMEDLFGETGVDMDESSYRVYGWWRSITSVEMEPLKYPTYGINTNRMVACNGVRTYFVRPDKPSCCL